MQRRWQQEKLQSHGARFAPLMWRWGLSLGRKLLTLAPLTTQSGGQIHCDVTEKEKKNTGKYNESVMSENTDKTSPFPVTDTGAATASYKLAHKNLR